MHGPNRIVKPTRDDTTPRRAPQLVLRALGERFPDENDHRPECEALPAVAFPISITQLRVDDAGVAGDGGDARLGSDLMYSFNFDCLEYLLVDIIDNYC